MKNVAILALGMALLSGSAWAGPHHMSFNPMGSKDSQNWSSENGGDNGKLSNETQVKFDGHDEHDRHMGDRDWRGTKEIEIRRVRLERLIRLLERDLRLGHGDRDHIRYEIARIEKTIVKDDGSQTNGQGMATGGTTVTNPGF